MDYGRAGAREKARAHADADADAEPEDFARNSHPAIEETTPSREHTQLRSHAQSKRNDFPFGNF